MTWLVLVDQDRDLSNADTPHKVMSTRDYLSRPQLFGGQKPKIINLSRSYGYQGAGYYCSLLAEARPPHHPDHRDHRRIVAQDALRAVAARSRGDARQMLREDQAAVRPGQAVRLLRSGRPGQPDALCPAPVRLVPRANSPRDPRRPGPQEDRPHRAGRHQCPERGGARLLPQGARGHTRRTWKTAKTRTPAKYTLAVLHDPQEKLPPSTQESIRHFAKVAQRFSIDVEPIQRGDLDKLAEYDALFIRVTTSIDNYTYRFARRAQQEGMPVIDDPQSMIRCTNKVYLAERLTAERVPTPKTLVVQSEKQAGELGERIGWPVVLKIPDGSFSRGVYKCDNAEELKRRLKQLLQDSTCLSARSSCPPPLTGASACSTARPSSPASTTWSTSIGRS